MRVARAIPSGLALAAGLWGMAALSVAAPPSFQGLGDLPGGIVSSSALVLRPDDIVELAILPIG